MPFGNNGYGNFSPADSRDVAFSVSDDNDIAMLIRYTGSEESGLVEVAADGNLVFTIGDLSAEAADTNVSTDGTIDVSGGSEDTLGEIVDIINATDDWEAVLVDAVRSDSANDTLLDAGPSQAKTPEGLAINWDTDVVYSLQRLIAPDALRTDIRSYLVNGTVNQTFPFVGTRGAVRYLSGLSTYGSGNSVFQLISTDDNGTDSVVFSKAAGATTVDADGIALTTEGEYVGNRSERLVARLDNSAAMATATLRGNGRLFKSLS